MIQVAENGFSVRMAIPYGGEGVRVGDFIVRTDPKAGKGGKFDKFFVIAPDAFEVLYGAKATRAPRPDRREVREINALGIHLDEDKGVKVGEANRVTVVGVGEEGMIFEINGIDPIHPDEDIERVPADLDHRLYLRRHLLQQGVFLPPLRS